MEVERKTAGQDGQWRAEQAPTDLSKKQQGPGKSLEKEWTEHAQLLQPRGSSRFTSHRTASLPSEHSGISRTERAHRTKLKNEPETAYIVSE